MDTQTPPALTHAPAAGGAGPAASTDAPVPGVLKGAAPRRRGHDQGREYSLLSLPIAEA